MINGPDAPDFGAAIRLGEKARDPNETRWGLLLVLFMRVGRGPVDPAGPAAMAHRADRAGRAVRGHSGIDLGRIIFFAVMDLLAAVGMWLATPWGGVRLWLLVTLSQIAVAIAVPSFFDGGVVVDASSMYC